MNEPLKKFFLIGLGIAAAGKDKAEKYLREFSAEGSAVSEETKSYLEKWSDKGKAKKNELKNDFRQEAREAIESLGFVTKEEYNGLRERLCALEKLSSLDQNVRPSEIDKVKKEKTDR